jgi:peptide deformylase
MKLKIIQFGNQDLRKVSRHLTKQEILSNDTQLLISAMRNLLLGKKLGVGLAAPQVGENIAVAVIDIQKTPLRTDVEPFSLVIINPIITKYYGRKNQLWEGCISSGTGKAALFAKVPRYAKIELSYRDEKGAKQIKYFDGLAAHVMQHEVDHLNGILFVDKVRDTKTYMTYSEYKKMKKRKL